MADSVVAMARKRLCIIAAGVGADGLALSAGQIILGSASASQAAGLPASFQANVPLLQVGGASLGYSSSWCPLTVEAELTVPLNPASETWTNADNLIMTLRAAWLNPAAYPAGELPASACDFEAFKAELRGDLTILRTILFVGFDYRDA